MSSASRCPVLGATDGTFHPGPGPVALRGRQRPGGAGAHRPLTRLTRRPAADRLAGRDHRRGGHDHPRDRGLARAVRQRHGLLRRGGRDRLLVGRLDRVLGRDHLQHHGGHRRLRGLQALADPPGHRRHPGPDHAVGVGVRGPDGGAGRLRLPLGRGGADPHRARGRRSGGHPGRHDREQRPGLLRRPGRPDHRAGGRYRAAAALAVRLDREDRRHAGPGAAVDPHLPGQRQAQAADRLAAGSRRLVRLHRGAVPHRRVGRALPARRGRFPGLLRRDPRPAAGLAAEGRARLRRPGTHRGRGAQVQRAGRASAGPGPGRGRAGYPRRPAG
jgi:hypothetical protein